MQHSLLPGMPRAFSVFVRGAPAPKGSKRAFKNKAGRAFVVDDNPKALKTWEAAVRHVVQDKWEGPPLEGAVRVTLTFGLLRPPSVSVRKRPHPTVKPDVDKIARAVLDPLSGIVVRDDAQVVDLHTIKEYADEAGVSIHVVAIV